ncbi:MAG: hypothetical protein WCO71_13650 [Pseudomonadota bacterium]
MILIQSPLRPILGHAAYDTIVSTSFIMSMVVTILTIHPSASTTGRAPRFFGRSSHQAKFSQLSFRDACRIALGQDRHELFSFGKGVAMDGKNPKVQPPRTHGLRLIKGAVSPSNETVRRDMPAMTSTVAPAKKIRHPLLAQLNALADAIDNDIKQILKS